MRAYLLPQDNLANFVADLAESGSVFYPFLEDNKAHFFKFNKNEQFKPNFTKIRAAENIKHFLFPSRDTVASFPSEVHKDVGRQYLFAVKNCDLRGVAVYDRVFMNWPPLDPFYRERRTKTVIISADCPEPEDSCFCNLVGLNPFADTLSDLNFTQISSGFLFESFTKTGDEIMQKMSSLFKEVSTQDEMQREQIRKAAVKKLKVTNAKFLEDNLSAKVGKANEKAMRAARNDCVECFACLHCCPTCYCFSLSDYQTGKNVERIRTWDACYYGAYARVGGGANPRPKMDERFWNRFQCKFNYFHQYENIYACSGCGRCYAGCSAKIDIREILWKM